MNTDTAQLNKRRDYRFPCSGQSVDAELMVGDRKIHAYLRNESSGGFGLYVDGEPPVKRTTWSKSPSATDSTVSRSLRPTL